MSDGKRVPLEIAQEIAAEVVELLSPSCERIEIAGSIRREAPKVGDIEIVAIPMYEAPPTDLFGDPVGDPYDLLNEQCLSHMQTGRFIPRLNKLGRKSIGPKLKWLKFYTGRKDVPAIALDVYACTPEQWGVTLAIRTGDADFSRRLVTRRSQGGLCPGYLVFRGWRVSSSATRQPLDTPEESDVFKALGIAYVEPRFRSAAEAVPA